MNPIPKAAQRELPQKIKTVNWGFGLQSLAGARLRKHSEFERAYAVARKRQSASMSWFLAPQGALNRSNDPSPVPSAGSKHGSPQTGLRLRGGKPGPRVGLTAGKVLGRAHDRNRIKRRMREALRRHVDLLPAGFDLILHPRRSVLTLEFAKLEAEVVRILEQVQAEAVGRAAGLP